MFDASPASAAGGVASRMPEVFAAYTSNCLQTCANFMQGVPRRLKLSQERCVTDPTKYLQKIDKSIFEFIIQYGFEALPRTSPMLREYVEAMACSLRCSSRFGAVANT
jgi:hypothetical protein